MKILVSDPLADEGLEVLNREKKLQVEVKPKLPPQELAKIIKDYEAIIIRSGTKLTKDIINRAHKLKVIGRAGVGLDNIDVAAASKRGVIVMNTPGGNTISTAEHTMSLILAMSRNIPQANSSLKAKQWNRKGFMGVELYEKTLGILGLGRIGKEVAKRAAAFGMKVIAHDPFLSPDRAKGLEVELIDLKELLKKADYISVHVPLTDQTRHMLSNKQFKMCKRGVKVVNCSRGGVVDEKALLAALKDGKVSCAALDVFEVEPPFDSPLLSMDNVIVTPHLGASTEEAQVKVAVDAARQVADALLGRGIRNAVNIPSVEPEVYKLIEPYIRLGEKLGALQAQLAKGPINRVNIRYHGEIVSHELSPVSVAIIKGILTPILQETVNYVNATVMAKERGIQVVESKSTQIENFANLISVEAASGKYKSVVWGTLFTTTDPRIVKIDRYYVDVAPSGYMLVISNLDKPGIVGHIGTILGKNKINIAGMTFGRERPGGDAITVLNVDNAVPDKVIKEVTKHKYILAARLIKL